MVRNMEGSNAKEVILPEMCSCQRYKNVDLEEKASSNATAVYSYSRSMQTDRAGREKVNDHSFC